MLKAAWLRHFPCCAYIDGAVAPEATADPSATVAPTKAPAETAAPTATPAA